MQGRASLSGLGAASLWFCLFISGFVIREPAPFDLIMLPVIACWFAFGGLKIHRAFAPAFFLMILFMSGGLLATTQVTTLEHAPLYMAVTGFMIAMFIFFANVVGGDERTLQVIKSGYIAGAVIVATFGILGYFHVIPGASNFTLYDRAKGTFQDPNVFGPFLVLPIALIMHDFLTKPFRRMVWWAPVLLWLVFAVFLSFSRAAWGLTALTLVGLTITVFIADPRPKTRFRLIVLAGAGVCVLTAIFAVALSFDVIAEMFETRAKLFQPYDSHRIGRFARWAQGFTWAFESPLGMGPLEFRNYFPEDPHNSYLKAFLAYGWIGGLAYFGFIFWTAIRGFSLLFKDRSWSPYFRCAYLVFIGHALIGVIIDTDHWRHVFLVYGLVWGCFILNAKETAAQRRLAPRPIRRATRHRPKEAVQAI